MFFADMYNKLMPKSGDCHRPNIWVGNLSFDSGEQRHEGPIGQNIVKILIRQQQDSFLLLIDIVDLG